MSLSPNIDKAIKFASRAHKDHVRKVGAVPYISHPVAVAMSLLPYDVSHETIIAALLHDTVEDTGVSLREIEMEFGKTVADYVGDLSEPKGYWEYRKLTYIDKMRGAMFPVKQISTADKLHNLTSIKNQIDQIGDSAWGVFSRPKPMQAWYYRTVFSALVENVESPKTFGLLTDLHHLIEIVFENCPSQAPEDF